MVWQDIVITIGQIIFAAALIPSIRGADKPAFSTSSITGSILAIFGITFATLQFWGSMLLSSLVAIEWFILAVQKFQMEKSVNGSPLKEGYDNIMNPSVPLWKRPAAIAPGIIIVAIAVAGVFLFQSSTATVVAVVNGETISEAELALWTTQLGRTQGNEAPSAAEEEQLRAQALKQLITKTLLLQYAKSLDFFADPAAVDEEMALIIRRVGGEEQFAETLAAQKLTKDDIRASVEEQLIIRQGISAYTKEQGLPLDPTDEEVRAAYDTAAQNQPDGSDPLPPFADVKDQITLEMRTRNLNAAAPQLVNALAANAEIILNP